MLFSKAMGLINMFFWTDTNNPGGAVEHIEALLAYFHISRRRPSSPAALLRHEDAATSAAGALDADSSGYVASGE